MYKNIVITAANAAYENSAKTLVSSIHKHSFDDVDQIYVFDLGLSKQERKSLNGCKKTTVVDFPDNVDCTPKQHVYKCYALHWGSEMGENVLWLDAGVMLLKSIKEMFEIINSEDIFLVKDPDHKNKSWTHQKCIDIMQATKEELNANQLSSGILGYKSRGKYQNLITEAYEFSKIQGCVTGSHATHRHDQSVYSILASRYNCPTQSIDKYGYWTDAKRTLKTAQEIGAVIFVHRNAHWDFKHLKR
jgi:lipopolysaccharide biosynthesis glycosyltransferase